MEKMELWEKFRTPPTTALKEIKGGRLNGKSDINPMWRIKTLTEQFGPCGIGWKYVITKQWLEHGGGEEIAAFVNIDLFYKYEGEWSDAIPGTGGSSFVTKESKGPYTSDECFKMALTDAISVSCKALGIAADVYWQLGSVSPRPREQNAPQQPGLATDIQIKKLFATAREKGVGNDDIKQKITDMGKTSTKELTVAECSKLIDWVSKWGEAV